MIPPWSRNKEKSIVLSIKLHLFKHIINNVARENENKSYKSIIILNYILLYNI